MGELQQLKGQMAEANEDGIIDDADFCQILNISARTSQRYRTEGLTTSDSTKDFHMILNRPSSPTCRILFRRSAGVQP